MKLKTSVIIPLLAMFAAFAQTLPMRLVHRLPGHIGESSGLAAFGSNRLVSFNDSGGEAALYIFDTLGNDLGTIYIDGAVNTDWEDIACDDDFIYIGDFGNNLNTRTNLRIYKVPLPEPLLACTLNAETIEFYYPDQTEFPPPESRRVFDCEAMVAFGESLYIFSKNNSSPFTGWTKRYALPKTSGSFSATLLDSFDTEMPSALIGQITAADIFERTLAIMSYRVIWFFQGFAGADFFDGTVNAFQLPTVTQTEALAFAHETGLFITDEIYWLYGIPYGGNLYFSDIGGLLAIEELPLTTALEIFARPNPFNSAVTIALETPFLSPPHAGEMPQAEAVQIEIFDISGRPVRDLSGLLSTEGNTAVLWDGKSDSGANLPSGIYFARARCEDKELVTKIALIR